MQSVNYSKNKHNQFMNKKSDKLFCSGQEQKNITLDRALTHLIVKYK